MKEGDKIKCIDADKQKVLKLNKQYTVMKIDNDRVYINEYKRYSFLKNRFEVLK